MCGIAGYIDPKAEYDIAETNRRIGEALLHRGPDSGGVWSDPNLGVSLIHRRLAILDLTPTGHQPMHSVSGRYLLIFNGEIYNFKAIAALLTAKLGFIQWRGHSDTEIILYAIETYGFTATLELLEGMFAIALWDRAEQKLYLARDRIGEKPLYYGFFNGVFGFASELKALKMHPKFNQRINRDAIGQFMLHSCIPAPLSIYQGICKLIPGEYLCLSYAEIVSGSIITTSQPYWQLSDYLEPCYKGSREDASNELEQLLTSVIAEQIVSDVPVGCFLSGGVDSSLIAALMQAQSSKAIETFSIGFNDPKYDESAYARAVAKHLGTNHHELQVSEREALEVIPYLPGIYDEPFADSSQIPTYLVSAMAKKKVTVVLSGDGGDELFGGYSSHIQTAAALAKLSHFPKPIRAILEGLTRLAGSERYKSRGMRLNQLLNYDYANYYLGLMSHWINQPQILDNIKLLPSLWTRPYSGKFINYMQYIDSVGYLPDDILVKVDRAAMANSLETRVPFLNHRVVEFAFSLPESYKLNSRVGKLPLREILYKYVPRNLIERPKHGFGIPIDRWIRADLKDWVSSLLSDEQLKQQDYLNVGLVKKVLNNHMSGKVNNGRYLWEIIMLQQWLTTNC